MKTILIVDDEPRTRLGIQKTLVTWSAGRHRIEIAASGVEALEWLKVNSAHIIITDVRMPEVDGLQMLEILAMRGQLPVVFVISGYAEFEYAQKALQLGAFDYLLKPLDKSKLIDIVKRALELDSGRERLGAMEKLVDSKLLVAGIDEARYSTVIKDAISYIYTHLHEAISMKQIADLLHLNASYFSVLFKEQTGVTFSDYLTRSRVQRAKELLVTSRMPIWEISEKVGYQTAKYFIKVFKDNEGISPSQYRHQVLDAEQIIQ
ncbi:MAG: response regulator [Candidatus Cohnella colombiensis]|uniref:Response regulator n=1 Tax=Candidatus Cohnella colombiensis TaxID=3121368 RepID=A0AA95EUR4_9BACL|nr:MAG: response regulator [Cohnella sp.]